MNILILCTGNSCRSQMAEGYLRHFANRAATIFSAGIEAHGLNPRAVLVMAEDHIDISGQTSNRVDEYQHISFDHVITVCDHANERCPLFQDAVHRWHQNFPDPAKARGSEEEILSAFRSVRDQIKSYCQDFTQHHIHST